MSQLAKLSEMSSVAVALEAEVGHAKADGMSSDPNPNSERAPRYDDSTPWHLVIFPS